MSELRQDNTTGAWVIISPDRGRRPSDTPARRRPPLPAHSFDPVCPFCPGHEAELPGILAEIGAGEPPGWQVRVVPDKYPAVRPERLIKETESFLALVPFAAAVPSEIWLVPQRHQASFAAMNEAECAILGRLLGRTLQRTNAAHDDPPHNLVLDSAGGGDQEALALHWRLRVAPDLVAWGGFACATDLPINPSLPEQDAARLRAASLANGSVRI